MDSIIILIRNMDSTTDFSFKALDKGAKDLGEKLTKELWQHIEAKLNKFDEDVTKKILSFVHSLFGVSDVSTVTNDNIKVLGDDFFSVLYNYLVENKLIQKSDVTESANFSEQKKSGGKKGGSKGKNEMKTADKIKLANSTETIQKHLVTACESFSYDDFHIPSAFTSKYVEIRAVGFLQCSKFLLKNKKKFFGKKSKLLFVNGIIVAFDKFIKASTQFIGESIMDSSKKIHVSSQFLDNLKIVLDSLKKEYEFNGLNVCNDTPQLAVYTDYDYVYPKSDFSLYESQVNLITEIYNAKQTNTPTLITLRTMTATGKTTIAVGGAEIVNTIRKSKSEDTSVFIFCCNIRQVMIQAAQLAYNARIPLAFAHIDQFVGLKITNNYNCKKESDRIMIICAPDACYEVLKLYPDAILFLDEPTIGLDQMTDIARQNVKLITESLPKITVLSSATLPEVCPPWILENLEIKYGSVKHIDIYSNKIHIGCEIRNLEGELVLPHLNCKSSSDLHHIINQITKNPFVGRAYTANVVKHIYDYLVSEKIENIPDVSAFFSDASNLSSDNIRNMAMELLHCIAMCPDVLVAKLCATNIANRQMDEIEEKVVKNDDDDIVWETEEKFVVGNSINYKTLGTKSAHRFLRPTLIATNNPTYFATENFSELLSVFHEKFGSCKNICDSYQQQSAIWQKQIDRFSRSKKDTTFSSELERMQSEDSLNENKPKIQIDGFQINTRKHIIEFAKQTKLAIDGSSIRHEIDVTPIFMENMNVPDEIRILLACGVGIYGVFSDAIYNSFVTKFMNDGSLAYIISDAGIAYGTNIPLNRIIATKDFCDTYSLNTIYQLISRAGRVGRSWIAEAFIDKNCASRIIDSIQTSDTKYNIEAINLEKLHDEIAEQNTFNDDALIIALVEKNLKEIAEKKIIEDKKRKEEEEAERVKNEKKKQVEEEQKKLEALRVRRQQSGSVNLSNVMNAPANNSFKLNGTRRHENTGFGNRRIPLNTNPVVASMPLTTATTCATATVNATATTNAHINASVSSGSVTSGFQRKSTPTTTGFQRTSTNRLDRLSRLN